MNWLVSRNGLVGILVGILGGGISLTWLATSRDRPTYRVLGAWAPIDSGGNFIHVYKNYWKIYITFASAPIRQIVPWSLWFRSHIQGALTPFIEGSSPCVNIYIFDQRRSTKTYWLLFQNFAYITFYFSTSLFGILFIN